jgi:hypothetical protein
VKSRDGEIVLPDSEPSAEDIEMQVKATLARLSGEREDSGEPPKSGQQIVDKLVAEDERPHK